MRELLRAGTEVGALKKAALVAKLVTGRSARFEYARGMGRYVQLCPA